VNNTKKGPRDLFEGKGEERRHPPRLEDRFLHNPTPIMSSVRLAMKRSMSGQAGSGEDGGEGSAAAAPTAAPPAAKKRKSTTPK